jgi:hypothetical protein
MSEKRGALSGLGSEAAVLKGRSKTHCPNAPTLLRIEETEAPHATSFSKEFLKKNRESLTGL